MSLTEKLEINSTQSEDKEVVAEVPALLLNDQEDLLKELHKAGYDVKSVWNFVNIHRPYKDAIPILVKHLSKPYSPRIKEGIVRALISKYSKGVANEKLFQEFYRIPNNKINEELRWAIGNTIHCILTKKDYDEVIKIAKDTSAGKGRVEFIRALGKIKTPEAIQATLEVLQNSESKDEYYLAYMYAALQAANRLKSPDFIPVIKEIAATTPTKPLRTEAMKVLRKLEQLY